MRYWQDIQPEETLSTAAITISKQDILDFAADFDPQPYHLDSSSADDSIFGGLCASGWQLCSLLNRLILEAFEAAEIAFVGTQSVQEQRWKVPVFADSTLSANLVIRGSQPESTDPSLGLIHCDIEVINQDQTLVLTQKGSFLIAHKPDQNQANQGDKI